MPEVWILQLWAFAFAFFFLEETTGKRFGLAVPSSAMLALDELSPGKWDWVRSKLVHRETMVLNSREFI